MRREDTLSQVTVRFKVRTTVIVRVRVRNMFSIIGLVLGLG